MLTQLGEQSLIGALITRNIPGASLWTKFGATTAGLTVGTVFSGNIPAVPYTYPQQAGFFYIASTDPDDNSTGTGCRGLAIQGLDENFKLQEEIIATNGQTPVQSEYKYWRVTRMANADSVTHDVQGQMYGSFTGTGWVAGEPTIRQGHINDGTNQSQLAAYAVPKGYKLVITNWDINSLKDREVEVWLAFRTIDPENNANSGVFRMQTNFGMFRSNIAINLATAPIVFDALDEFEVRCKAISQTEQIYSTMVGYLVPEKFFGVS